MDIDIKLQNLQKNLLSRQKLAVAFSGGIDSAFLLKTAHDVLGDKVIALTVNAPFFPNREIQAAKEFTAYHDLQHIIINLDDLEGIEDFSTNPIDRCYKCKQAIFKHIKQVAHAKGFFNLADGSNYDDQDDFRPGQRALQEMQILSPLLESKMTKQDIISLAQAVKIKIWNKPASACLASRIPYGEKITIKKLAMIEAAESFLMQKGFSQVRVRHHGDIARIEVVKQERKLFTDSLVEETIQELKKLGYSYITLDLAGYRTGSLNEVLKDTGNGS